MATMAIMEIIAILAINAVMAMMDIMGTRAIRAIMARSKFENRITNSLTDRANCTDASVSKTDLLGDLTFFGMQNATVSWG